MDIEQLRDYCLSLPGAEESFPFGEDVLAFKIKGKIFLLVSLSEQPLSFNVKCEPERALSLREEYTAVLPGYHMNKKHWNTVIVDGSLYKSQLLKMIDHSFELVSRKK